MEERDLGTRMIDLNGDDNSVELEPSSYTGEDGRAEEDVVVGGRGDRQ
jgi:hypothetical protein